MPTAPDLRRRDESNRVEELWRKYKRRLFLLLLALPVILVGVEASYTILFAYGVRTGRLPKETLEVLFLGHLLFPDLASSTWEKSYGLRVHPGDFQEEYNSNEGFRPDTLVAWKPRENSTILRFGHPVFVNSQGFVSTRETNDFFVSREKPKEKLRVIVIGGSTVYGIGAMPSESVPAQIEAALTARLGPGRVEVINGGVGGYTSSNELLYLVSELVTYHPDLVIAYDGWNDVHFHNFQATSSGARWFPLRNKIYEGHSWTLDSAFRPASAAYDFAGTTLKLLRHEGLAVFEGSAVLQAMKLVGGRTFLLPYLDKFEAWLKDYDHSDNTNVAYDPRVATAYRHNLDLMAAVAQHFGFRMAFFFQPFMGPAQKPFTAEESRIFNTMDKLEVQSRTLFGRDAAKVFVELGRKFRGRRDLYAEDISQVFRDVTERTFFYTGHLNAAGNRIVASRIVSSLERQGWFRSKP